MVVPVAVLEQWKSELLATSSQFTESNVVIYHGPSRRPPTPNVMIVITSYDTLRSEWKQYTRQKVTNQDNKDSVSEHGSFIWSRTWSDKNGYVREMPDT